MIYFDYIRQIISNLKSFQHSTFISFYFMFLDCCVSIYPVPGTGYYPAPVSPFFVFFPLAIFSASNRFRGKSSRLLGSGGDASIRPSQLGNALNGFPVSMLMCLNLLTVLFATRRSIEQHPHPQSQHSSFSSGVGSSQSTPGTGRRGFASGHIGIRSRLGFSKGRPVCISMFWNLDTACVMTRWSRDATPLPLSPPAPSPLFSPSGGGGSAGEDGGD